MICKNCHNDFEGQFCNTCGQSADVQKINFKQLLGEIFVGFFQVDRGLFFTIKELFTRPGDTIREYLEGRRKPHFRPLAFVLFVAAVYLILIHFTGASSISQDALTGFLLAENGSDGVKAYPVLHWLASNFTYSTLLLLPVFSLASYLAFIKSKYNYFEHLVMNFYLTGQQIIIYSLFTLPLFFFPGIQDFMVTISFFLSIFWTFWTFIQFFDTKKLRTKIALIVLTYLLFVVLLVILPRLFFLLYSNYSAWMLLR